MNHFSKHHFVPLQRGASNKPSIIITTDNQSRVVEVYELTPFWFQTEDKINGSVHKNGYALFTQM